MMLPEPKDEPKVNKDCSNNGHVLPSMLYILCPNPASSHLKVYRLFSDKNNLASRRKYKHISSLDHSLLEEVMLFNIVIFMYRIISEERDLTLRSKMTFSDVANCNLKKSQMYWPYSLQIERGLI